MDLEDQQTFSTSVARIVVGCLGIISNILQIILISRSSERRTVFTMTLLSLSIADLIASIMASSYACIVMISALNIRYNDWFAFIGLIGLIFSSATSTFHILFIGIQRLCVVMFPLRFKRIFTTFRSRIVLTVIWIASAATAALLAFFPRFINRVCGYALIIACVMLIFLYSWLCYIMHKHHQDGRHLHSSNRKKNARIFIYSVAVLSSYVICSIPMALTMLLPERVFGNFGFRLSGVIFTLNPLFDSLLYFLSSYCRRNRVFNSSSRKIKTEIGNVAAVARDQEVTEHQTTSL